MQEWYLESDSVPDESVPVAGRTSERSFMRNIIAVALLCAFPALAVGVAASQQQQTSDSKLSLKISALPVNSGDTAFQVTFENLGNTDLLLNMGFMLANGQKQEPVAMSLIIAREGESPMEWQYAVKYGVGGRLDDYLVPLRAGSTYSLRLSLTQFWSANLKDFALPSLRSGSYRIRAQFNGGGRSLSI